MSNYLALPAISRYAPFPSATSVSTDLRRTLATATGILSFLIHVGIWNASHFIFHHSMLWKFPPQIWRVATAFMLTGPGIGLIFDTYFLYVYLVQFEVGNPRFKYKEDLIWFLLVVCGTILVSLVVCLISRLYTSYICPDSVMPLLLSRFLKLRKITPALRVSPSFAKIRAGLRRRHGGMSYGWLVRFSIRWSGFYSSLHFYTF